MTRHLRINNLIRLFKNLADDNKIALLVAVDVSYLSEEEQETVYKVIDKKYDKNIIRLPRQYLEKSRKSL
ncbi:MAG: hypothetical protein J1F42_15005 [Lachnospiraceae bacterium]|nr:hypothetical protein [Lachnospiraceae bacterium]